MDDDGTRENKVRRDGGAERGASQTHGAGDASGVDVEPDIPPLRFHDEDAEEPPAVTPPSSTAPLS